MIAIVGIALAPALVAWLIILETEDDEDVVVVVVAELEEDVAPIGETPSTIHCITSLSKPTLLKYRYDLKNQFYYESWLFIETKYLITQYIGTMSLGALNSQFVHTIVLPSS